MIFEGLYLLHQPLDFNFIFWDGFQIESSFSGRNLDPKKGVLKVRHRFECKRCRFGLISLYKRLGSFYHCRAIILAIFFFDDFFWCKGIIRMDVSNFLVGDILIAIGLLVVFSLQSKNDGFL